MLLNCGIGEESWESLGLRGDPTSPFWRRSALGFLGKEWCSSTLATSCKELTHWKRLWCWDGLGAGGEGDDRGWDGWMASMPSMNVIRWTWVWVNSGSWWWTGRPGVLRFMGSQRVGHDWATELNWTEWWFIPSFLWLYQFIFPPTVQKRCLFFTPSLAFILCRHFDDGHSDCCEVISHCSFDLHFFNNEQCWASFHVFFSHLCVFFGEMSV